MSGTFGYDGYIYQANVALYLLIQKILNREGLDRIELELRKVDPEDRRKDEFTVDLLLFSSTSTSSEQVQKCDIVEVKGGQGGIDIDDVVSNLSQCAEELKLANPTLLTTPKLILRKQEQDITIDGIFIERVEDTVDSASLRQFTSLEERIQSDIQSILNEFIGPKEIAFWTRIVFYSLRHLVEHKIKKLAHALRENSSPTAMEVATITINELFDHQESFTHTLQNVKGDDASVAREKLKNFNKIPTSTPIANQQTAPIPVSPTNSGENI